MQKTREEILSYLARNPGSSAREIGRFLDMTPANIRYHLDLLINSGKVQVGEKRSPGGAGRPNLLYTLTSLSLGINLEGLLTACLDVIGEVRESDQAIKDIAAKLAKDFDSNDKRTIIRINQAIDYLNQLNYHAIWEVHPGGPQIELRHCPYGSLAQEHQVICQIDQKLISDLIGRPVEMIKKRSFAGLPHSPCIFHLTSNN
jgi:predicted ArsR family transcriptional regulator